MQNLEENPSALELNFPVALKSHTGLVKQSINFNKGRIHFRREIYSVNQYDGHFFVFGRIQQGCQDALTIVGTVT